MRGFTKRATSLAMVLGLGGVMVACDNNDMPMTVDSGVDGGGPRDSGSDTGSEPVDSGPDEDGGPIDSGPADGGPPPAFLRLAHLIPGAPAIHVCIQIPAGAGVWNLITVDSVTRAPLSIPYAGVSPYTTALQLPAIPLQVAVYDAADITGSTCPAATTDAIINQMINGSAANTGGAHYTIAATGLPTGGADETLPELVIFTDDLTAPATAGDTRIRLVNAVPNMPAAAAGIDLCVDPDGAGEMPAVEIADDITFEEAGDYAERAPLVADAVLSLHAHTAGAPDCFAATRLAQIPVPIPLPAGVPANYTDTFDADTSNTIFFIGNGMVVMPGVACTVPADCATAGVAGTTCGPAGTCTHPLAPTIIPILDITH